MRSGSRPRLADPGANPPQPGGGLLERICPVGPFSIVPRRLAGGRTPRPPGGDATERRSLRDVGAAGLACASTPVGEGRMAPETAAVRRWRPIGLHSRAQALGQATVRICIQWAKEVPGSQGHGQLRTSRVSGGCRRRPCVPVHSKPLLGITAWPRSIGPRCCSGFSGTGHLARAIHQNSQRVIKNCGIYTTGLPMGTCFGGPPRHAMP